MRAGQALAARRDREGARETAEKGEPVEVECPCCGEPVEVSASYYEKVRAQRVPAPPCYGCKRPARAAETDAEAVLFVELLGDSAEELAAAVAALG